MYIGKILDLRVQLMKNGGKYKRVAFIILFSVYIYIYTLNLRGHVLLRYEWE